MDAPPEISIVTVAAFAAWARSARPGARLVYAHTAPGESLLGWVTRRARVRAIRNAAWALAREGRATLVQQRTDDGGLDYIAVAGRFAPPAELRGVDTAEPVPAQARAA